MLYPQDVEEHGEAIIFPCFFGTGGFWPGMLFSGSNLVCGLNIYSCSPPSKAMIVVGLFAQTYLGRQFINVFLFGFFKLLYVSVEPALF